MIVNPQVGLVTASDSPTHREDWQAHGDFQIIDHDYHEGPDNRFHETFYLIVDHLLSTGGRLI